MTYQEELYQAVSNNDLDRSKSLIINTEVNPIENCNWAMAISSDKGHFDIVKLLLKDPRVNPSDDDNFPICYIESHMLDLRLYFLNISNMLFYKN